jgi:hypothetical protein
MVQRAGTAFGYSIVKSAKLRDVFADQRRLFHTHVELGKYDVLSGV